MCRKIHWIWFQLMEFRSLSYIHIKPRHSTYKYVAISLYIKVSMCLSTLCSYVSIYHLCIHVSGMVWYGMFSWVLLCDPMDYSPLGSSVHEIFPARILSWLPFATLGNVPNPGIEPGSLHWQADSLSNSQLLWSLFWLTRLVYET